MGEEKNTKGGSPGLRPPTIGARAGVRCSQVPPPPYLCYPAETRPDRSRSIALVIGAVAPARSVLSAVDVKITLRNPSPAAFERAAVFDRPSHFTVGRGAIIGGWVAVTAHQQRNSCFPSCLSVFLFCPFFS